MIFSLKKENILSSIPACPDRRGVAIFFIISHLMVIFFGALGIAAVNIC